MRYQDGDYDDDCPSWYYSRLPGHTEKSHHTMTKSQFKQGVIGNEDAGKAEYPSIAPLDLVAQACSKILYLFYLFLKQISYGLYLLE